MLGHGDSAEIWHPPSPSLSGHTHSDVGKVQQGPELVAQWVSFSVVVWPEVWPASHPRTTVQSPCMGSLKRVVRAEDGLGRGVNLARGRGSGGTQISLKTGARTRCKPCLRPRLGRGIGFARGQGSSESWPLLCPIGLVCWAETESSRSNLVKFYGEGRILSFLCLLLGTWFTVLDNILNVWLKFCLKWLYLWI
jgi:hypothetical protein